MNESETEQCRQRLLILRAELLALEESAKEAKGPEHIHQAGMDRLSRADAMQKMLADEEGSRQRKRRLQKIEGALRRLKLGEFGRCFVCEKEIDACRLSADPTITRCEDCEEESSPS